MHRALSLVTSVAAVACGGHAARTQMTPTSPTTSPPPAAPQAPPAAAMPAIPQTPAGVALRAWLDVFNSGDEARMRAFTTQHGDPDIIDPGFRAFTGGFELQQIHRSESHTVTFVVKEKARPMTALGWLTVKAADPTKIAGVSFQLIPPGMTAADLDRPIDAATRTRVLDAAATKLTELYVFPDVGKRMAKALRDHAAAGTYDTVTDARAFAKLLTEHLRAVSRDLHLGVSFHATPIPEATPDASADEAQQRAQLESMNCGFRKAERLDGNIGYLKFDMFGPPSICGPKATEAFAAIGSVDALVVDLRDNGGGDPEMVAFVSSYLFAKRTHLNSIYDRPTNKTTKFYTKPDVPGAKLATQPVFVLTSKRTFSGAEEFAYNLKNLKRATILGETTGGGAHPTMGVRLDTHFQIGIPSARAINPITKTNWEGIGVKPDVEVAAELALETAKQLAAERLAKQRPTAK